MTAVEQDGAADLDDLDLGDMARAALQVGTGAPEIAWVQHAWSALACAGLVACETQLERAAVACRLLALTVLHEQFCVRAFDEGDPDEWEIDPHDLLGTYPRLDPFLIGVLAERRGLEADIELGYELERGTLTSEALRELVVAEYPTVARALRAAWGGTGVFGSLWVSRSDDTTYPLSEDVIDDIVNGDLTHDKLHAWQWIDSGMPL